MNTLYLRDERIDLDALRDLVVDRIENSKKLGSPWPFAWHQHELPAKIRSKSPRDLEDPFQNQKQQTFFPSIQVSDMENALPKNV